MTEQQPVHSPLGASSAERWMACPGSVELIKLLELPESDEPDYRANGIAAHEAAAECLRTDKDAWELVGQKFHDIEVDVEIADAIQMYLDTVRPHIANALEVGQAVFVEHRISSPIHPKFYGTVDLAVIERGTEYHKQEILDLTDYKHGEGIMVDAEENPQLMYYAYGILQEFPEVEKVRLRICQPRGFHVDGPVRTWETTATHIKSWVENVLVPAMYRVEIDNNLDAGNWCRFCPAKLVCPLLTALFGAAMKANPDHIINLSNESLGRSYGYKDGVKFYMKAMEEETMRRNLLGQKVPGTKLVHKKANRVFKSGADTIFKTHFGEQAMTKPTLKSPAALEEISSQAKNLVKEWAYTPESGLTVARDDDPRHEVKVITTQQTFGATVERLAKQNDDGLDIPDFLKRKDQ